MSSNGVHSTKGRASVVAAGSLVIIAIGIATFLRGPGLSGTNALVTPTFNGDPAAIERGSALFAAQCATCHGAEGRGDGPAAASLDPKPIDFTNPIHRGHTDADLTRWISDGVEGSSMPAFSGALSREEIADIITYIRSLQALAPAEPSVDVPEPSDCTIAPRPPQSLKPAGTVTPLPAPTKAPAVGPETFPWPQGEPASQDEIDGVTRSIREFHACADAGDYPRRLALYTDRVLNAQFGALDDEGWRIALDFVATPPAVVAPGDRQWIESISAVRHLPDGRVGAYVVAADPINHPHLINAVIIFAKVGDRWLIDEVHEDPVGNMGVPVRPTPNSHVPIAGVETPITSGGLLVTLVNAPAAIGNGNIVVQVNKANGEPVSDAQVQFGLEMADMAMDIEEVTAISEGDGRYGADFPVGMPGLWQIQVTIRQANGNPVTFSFTFETG